MPTERDNALPASADFLAADEPAPFTVENPAAMRPVLLVCDHASRRLPRALGDLGLDPLARRSHLAIDIGAADLTRQLASSIGTTAVLAAYSRLAVDPNRDLLDEHAFLEFGDGVVIPGNRGLTQEQKATRARQLYWPYHRAIDAEIERLSRSGQRPAVVAIHSFAPVLDGISRPWEIGILWDADERISARAIARLREAGFVVGDNEPYSGKAPQDFTIDRHAEDAGLPHVGIEVRQDLIDDDAGVRRIAAILHEIIADLPPSLFAGEEQGSEPAQKRVKQGG